MTTIDTRMWRKAAAMTDRVRFASAARTAVPWELCGCGHAAVKHRWALDEIMCVPRWNERCAERCRWLRLSPDAMRLAEAAYEEAVAREVSEALTR